VAKPVNRSVGQERVMTVHDIGVNAVIRQTILETVERQTLDAEKSEFQLFMSNVGEFLLGQVTIRHHTISLQAPDIFDGESDILFRGCVNKFQFTISDVH